MRDFLDRTGIAADPRLKLLVAAVRANPADGESAAALCEELADAGCQDLADAIAAGSLAIDHAVRRFAGTLCAFLPHAAVGSVSAAAEQLSDVLCAVAAGRGSESDPSDTSAGSFSAGVSDLNRRLRGG